MSYKLFLDDYRQPIDCFGYMHARIGDKVTMYLDKDWVVVKHYAAFINYITENGVPNIVSFDHDLADSHYNEKYQNGIIDYSSEDFNKNYFKTGYHCADWLLNYCIHNRIQFPTHYTHSMNPIGTENIETLIQSCKQHYDFL